MLTLVSKDTSKLKVKGWKKFFHATFPCNQNRDGVAMLITDKIVFNSKMLQQTKEGHFISIKGAFIKKI